MTESVERNEIFLALELNQAAAAQLNSDHHGQISSKYKLEGVSGLTSDVLRKHPG